MVERRRPAGQYPLTADLAGVLAAAQQEQTPVQRRERMWPVTRFFRLLGRVGWRSTDRASDKPLDSIPAVR